MSNFVGGCEHRDACDICLAHLEKKYPRVWCNQCARCCDFDDCYFDETEICLCCREKDDK